MHPLNYSKFPCTVMAIDNLAYPQWLSIACNEKLLRDYICVTDKNVSSNSSGNTSSSLFSCNHVDFILKSQQCYKFQWENLLLPLTADIFQKKISQGSKRKEISPAKRFEIIFTAVNGKVAPLIFLTATNLSLHTYEQFYSEYYYEVFSLNASKI